MNQGYTCRASITDFDFFSQGGGIAAVPAAVGCSRLMGNDSYAQCMIKSTILFVPWQP
jgi:hypothetical protein